VRWARTSRRGALGSASAGGSPPGSKPTSPGRWRPCGAAREGARHGARGLAFALAEGSGR
jgi:hypothetical protein